MKWFVMAAIVIAGLLNSAAITRDRTASEQRDHDLATAITATEHHCRTTDAQRQREIETLRQRTEQLRVLLRYVAATQPGRERAPTMDAEWAGWPSDGGER